MKPGVLTVLIGLSLSGCMHVIDLRAPHNLWREAGVHQFGSATIEVGENDLVISDPGCGRFVLRNPKWLVAASHSYAYEVVQASEVSAECASAEGARYAQVAAVLDEEGDPARFPFGQRITYTLATCSISDGPHCVDLVARYIDFENGDSTRNITADREAMLARRKAGVEVDSVRQGSGAARR